MRPHVSIVWRRCGDVRARVALRSAVVAAIAWLVVSASPPAIAQTSAAEGRIAGRVTDAASGAALSGATIVLSAPGAGQLLRTSGADGGFLFESVGAGTYRLDLTLWGYQAASIAQLTVQAGQEIRADQKMSARPAEESDRVSSTAGVEEIVVHGDPTKDLLSSIETRSQSDQLVNVLGAEDLSKFAVVDMADALKRVAGVNVVEGQFAIVRGLEDRYSSTLYNSAPVPSPDPDRQSPQLDLFPSEIVNSLVVSKTFGQELPSNSSGGSIDILTPDRHEDELEVSISAKTGINENAYDRFIELRPGSSIGKETDGVDLLEQEFGGYVNGRTSLRGREIHYKAVANWGTDYVTEEGFQEGRQPAVPGNSIFFPAGDLSFGQLGLSDGRFDLTTSEGEEQMTLFGTFGFDVDEFSDHTIDFSAFYTRKDIDTVQLREYGHLPGFDYPAVKAAVQADPFEFPNFSQFQSRATFDAWIVKKVGPLGETPTRTIPYYAAFFDSRSFESRRDLQIYQINGDHILDLLIDGLHLSWVGNYATTAQNENSLGSRFSFEPCRNDTVASLRCPTGVTPINQNFDLIPASLPVREAALAPGQYLARNGLFGNHNDIEEEQYFGRFDGDYELLPAHWLTANLSSGLWFEHAERDVDSSFLSGDGLTINCPESSGCIGTGSTQYVIFADTPEQLGARIFGTGLPRTTDGSYANQRSTTNESTREIQAMHAGAKATFWGDFDLLGGARFENIFIESKNDPFVPGGFSPDQSPLIFPSKYLFFDRFDNLDREGFIRNPPFNNEILGIDVPAGPCRDTAGNPIPGGGECVDLIDAAEIGRLVNGDIDENKVLPSAGLAYRAFDWLTLRGAYSQTVARPSFRELGYYVSAEPGTDDLSIGNPQLGLSDVESWDARAEFVWGNYSDLFAVSVFQKDIEDPIEQIVMRDPGVFEDTATDTFRTFFNNPNEATIRGIELEARKNLGFLTFDWLETEVPGREFLGVLEYFSIGGNYSFFDAEVRRTEAELARSVGFFGNPLGGVPFPGLERKRRLYAQPEWIANADISFDHLGWGTKVTLAYFAISDLLDAAGVAAPSASSAIDTFVLDRYVDSFEQLDLIVSQELWRGLTVKLTVKNLTDSKRGIIYDPEQTLHRVAEREYRRGRDYGLSLRWTF